MTTDDDMREIEAAMGVLLNAYDSMDTVRADEARAKLLALIRQKLPQTDAEHERAVAAWEAEATRISIHCGGAMQMVQRLRDEGVRLMQRPSDAEHEAKVEAWHDSVTACRLDGLRTETGFHVYGIPYVLLEDALRLMRARPAGTAAGDLLRAARTKIRNEASNNACEDYAAGMHRAADIIEEAERGLPIPDWRQRVAINSAIDICVRDAAVADLLRAAKNAIRVIGRHCDAVQLQQAIEAAKRAGIGTNTKA